MGLDNPIHLALLLMILLLVFGAKRLPEMGRSLGSGLRGFKESISGEQPAEQVDAFSPTVEVAPATLTPSADQVPAAVSDLTPAHAPDPVAAVVATERDHTTSAA
ncbi:MAG: twin-arginine translocase TatA/TatE family subunit [Solirubrobacteraceae bacterium]